MILRRLPDSRYSEVLPEWKGETVALLGGGPSLTLAQVEVVQFARGMGKLKVIAINDSYLLAPWADVHYAADSHWHAWHTAGVARPMLGLTAAQVAEKWFTFAGQKCSLQGSGANITDDRVHLLRNKHFPVHGLGLSSDPQCLVTGRNGGYQSINLSILAGGNKILLLGFDGRPNQNGKTHWHEGHARPTPVAAYAEYRAAFSAAQKDIQKLGVTVLNCSPSSFIDTFPKMPLEEALEEAALV